VEREREGWRERDALRKDGRRSALVRDMRVQ